MITANETAAVQEYINERGSGAQLYRYQIGDHVCYGVGAKGAIVTEILDDISLERLSQGDVTQLALDIVVNSATDNSKIEDA